MPRLEQSGCRGGHQIFIDELTRFAARTGDTRVARILERLSAPLRVWVGGRPGVGRRTVRAALVGAGVEVVPSSTAEVTVWVFAEAFKPEDRVALDATDRPKLAVHNKVDLAGGLPATPAATCPVLAGAPKVPMAALLATAVLDEELLGALRMLTLRPADMRTTDAFLDSPHPLPRTVRERLLATLDRHGITEAVHALTAQSHSPAPEMLPDLFRRLSGVDRLTATLHDVAAPVRYQRVRGAIAELQLLAAASADEPLADFLVTDDTVISVMAEAIDVMQAAGLTVQPADEPTAQLRRAAYWRRFSNGPVDVLHRQCGADICRGALRLLARGCR